MMNYAVKKHLHCLSDHVSIPQDNCPVPGSLREYDVLPIWMLPMSDNVFNECSLALLLSWMTKPPHLFLIEVSLFPSQAVTLPRSMQGVLWDTYDDDTYLSWGPVLVSFVTLANGPRPEFPWNTGHRIQGLEMLGKLKWPPPFWEALWEMTVLTSGTISKCQLSIFHSRRLITLANLV